MSTAVSPKVLAAEVFDLLSASDLLTTYSGLVPDQPPVDPDGLVHPYAVLWPGAGVDPHDRLHPTRSGLRWTCQVTAVGGDVERCLDAAWEIRQRLGGKRVLGRILVEILVDPGPPRPDTSVRPARYVLATMWRANV